MIPHFLVSSIVCEQVKHQQAEKQQFYAEKEKQKKYAESLSALVQEKLKMQEEDERLEAAINDKYVVFVLLLLTDRGDQRGSEGSKKKSRKRAKEVLT